MQLAYDQTADNQFQCVLTIHQHVGFPADLQATLEGSMLEGVEHEQRQQDLTWQLEAALNTGHELQTRLNILENTGGPKTQALQVIVPFLPLPFISLK